MLHARDQFVTQAPASPQLLSQFSAPLQVSTQLLSQSDTTQPVAPLQVVLQPLPAHEASQIVAVQVVLQPPPRQLA